MFNHTCSLHTCVCAGSRRRRVRLSGFRRQGISSAAGGFSSTLFRSWSVPNRISSENKKFGDFFFYGVVYVYLHLILRFTLTPTLDMKRLFVIGSCLPCVFGKLKRNGIFFPVRFNFYLRKEKTVVARLQCLIGALLYTSSIV